MGNRFDKALEELEYLRRFYSWLGWSDRVRVVVELKKQYLREARGRLNSLFLVGWII